MTDRPSEPPAPRERVNTLERLWGDVQRMIEGSHLFRSLEDEGRHELLMRGRLLLFAAGSVIVREGDAGDSFFMVDQGVVEVSTRLDGSAGDVSLTTLQRGAFFGEVGVLTGSARTATVVALTDVTAVEFEKKDVDELLTSNPKARRLLDAVMAGRARDAAEKIARASGLPPRDPGTGNAAG